MGTMPSRRAAVVPSVDPKLRSRTVSPSSRMLPKDFRRAASVCPDNTRFGTKLSFHCCLSMVRSSTKRIAIGRPATAPAIPALKCNGIQRFNAYRLPRDRHRALRSDAVACYVLLASLSQCEPYYGRMKAVSLARVSAFTPYPLRVEAATSEA